MAKGKCHIHFAIDPARFYPAVAVVGQISSNVPKPRVCAAFETSQGFTSHHRQRLGMLFPLQKQYSVYSSNEPEPVRVTYEPLLYGLNAMR